jgi:hypothetical protein
VKLGIPYGELRVSGKSPSDILADFQNARLDYYRDARLVLSSESGVLVLPLVCRGMDAYHDRTVAFFNSLRDLMVAESLGAVVLRLSPRSEHGKSPLDSLLEMEGIVNRFVSWLASFLGHRPEYVWAIEPSKRGHCHLHLVFIGIEYLCEKALIDEWWASQGLGTSSGVWIERLRPGRDSAQVVLDYLLKYITKGGGSKWDGLLSLTRRRSWGMSSRLRSRILEHEKASSSVLTCTRRLNNSNSLPAEVVWNCEGIFDLRLVEALLMPSGVPVVPPDVAEALASLRSIQGISRSFSGGTPLNVIMPGHRMDGGVRYPKWVGHLTDGGEGLPFGSYHPDYGGDS